MRTVESLHRRAEECREHARFVRDPELQAQWLDMAESWLRLACDPQDGAGNALALSAA
jgi:hypothetical protein